MNQTWETILTNNPVNNTVSTESTVGNYRQVLDYCQTNLIPLPVNKNDVARVKTETGLQGDSNVSLLGLPQLTDGTIAHLSNGDKYTFVDGSFIFGSLNKLCSDLVNYWGECIHVAQSSKDNRVVVFKKL